MKAKQQKMLITFLAVALSAIFISALVLAPNHPKHQAIIDAMEIRETTHSYLLTPEFQRGKVIVYGVPLSTLNFVEGSRYKQTAWFFVNPNGDVDAAVTVWGPDESGSGYFIEVSRMTGYGLTVKILSQLVVFEELSDWSTLTHKGYCQLEVHLG